MPRLLITGGTGYLGGALVRLAVADPAWSVAATYCTQLPAWKGARAERLDLRDPAMIAALFDRLRPEVVIHTAYVQDGPDLDAITAVGAGLVAQAARAHGARLIHLSSDALFAGDRRTPYTEDDDPSPITPYGAAKAAAERLVAVAHPGALIVRTSLIYGDVAPSKHEALVLDAADGRRAAAFFTDEIRCPVQVGDLARALLEVARMEIAGRLHLGGADAVSRYEFACLIAAAHGRPTNLLRPALSAASGMVRPRACALDSTRAARLLATRLRGVREVLGGGT